MNANQIFNMITRMFLRRVVNKGMNAGLSRMSGGGKPQDRTTGAEQSQARKGKQAVRTARKAARITRRMGKF
ncbi:hypothetical protein SAMN05216196_10843 [Lutimaribacter pacificus]|uniref:Uncharacterized protein n=1 Tax=Lutimaribacter pacificus TaxID=391948 RepID=A0A1H0LLI4_9RHOB|nr:hypothetical protein [Lutimaribacter pacificus]SDO68955.1 hypothetical protein SAMN05216196_10843 [Lutimaribacter pacificus]SHK05872.1 hypothetical protein SAMN05444142_103114 [Lutimaribacter pacificus]